MIKNLGSLANRVVYFTVKNPIAAKRLTDLLIKTPNDLIILPFIDYPGPLSREILSRKFGSLTVCERDNDTKKLFHSHVKDKFSNRKIYVYSDDLFDLSFKAYCDAAQKRCLDIVNESLSIENRTISNETCDKHVKFLVPLLKSRYEAGFLRNLYYQMSLKLGLCSNTLVHYYFLMSDRQYNYLNAKPGESLHHYRSSTILYNTIFNIHRLDSFDLETCFEINLKKIQKTAEINNSSYQKVHMIWLEPRLDVINNLNPRSLMEFRFLVNQLMHRRTGLVLPSLEKWFDNCSEELVRMGITGSTRSGDLDKEQYYKLYIYLKDREDYRNSTFLQAAAHAEENILSL